MQDRARSFVVCGRPLPGHEVMIVDDMGRMLGERKVGRIVIKGPSLMAGYFGNAAATKGVMHARRLYGYGRHGLSGEGEHRRHRPSERAHPAQWPEHLAPGSSSGRSSESNPCAAAMWPPSRSRDRRARIKWWFWSNAGSRSGRRWRNYVITPRQPCCVPAASTARSCWWRRGACLSPPPESCRGCRQRRCSLPTKSAKSDGENRWPDGFGLPPANRARKFMPAA